MKSAQDFMIEIPVARESDGITKARQILRDDQFRELYVADAKKTLSGYIDITDALRVTATKSNVTLEGYIKEAPATRPQDPVEHVARLMRGFRTDSVAIVDEKRKILGGVLLSDIFPVICSRNELPGKVGTRMSGTIVAAKPTDTIQKIYTLIVESGFSAFPVVKKKCLVGIVSRRDLISTRSVRPALSGHAQKTVEDVMKTPVITIGPGEQISAAANLLVKYDVSRLPVLDGEVMVGILDRHDILNGLA